MTRVAMPDDDVANRPLDGGPRTLTATARPIAAVCERCARPTDPDALWMLSIAVRPDPPAQRTICVECVASVREHLLATPAGGRDERDASPNVRRARLKDAGGSRRAQVTALFVRSFVYLSIAIAVFLLITFLTLR